jgi:hypothetical protein
MYLYWRIQQDLSCLGEEIVFHDPSFSRNFKNWVRRNAEGLRLAHDFDQETVRRPNLN